MNTCPVCGYNQLDFNPEDKDNSICPSCGTEFGYDDIAISYAELRSRWRASGMPWFNTYVSQPSNWDAQKQLLRLVHTQSVALQSDD